MGTKKTHALGAGSGALEKEVRETFALARGEQNERISVRVDEKLKFALEFAGSVTGHSQKKLVQTALDKALKDARLPNKTNWLDYWDADEGVRQLRLLYAPDYPSSAEDDRRRIFINEHRDFFFKDGEPRRDYLAVLWPHVEHYADSWRRSRTTSNTAVWQAMLEHCQRADLPPLYPDPSQAW